MTDADEGDRDDDHNILLAGLLEITSTRLVRRAGRTNRYANPTHLKSRRGFGFSALAEPSSHTCYTT